MLIPFEIVIQGKNTLNRSTGFIDTDNLAKAICEITLTEVDCGTKVSAELIQKFKDDSET